MKSWINKLGGVLLASLLTVMLNGKAYAEEKTESPAMEASTPAASEAEPDISAAITAVASDSPAAADSPMTVTDGVETTTESEIPAADPVIPASDNPGQVSDAQDETPVSQFEEPTVENEAVTANVVLAAEPGAVTLLDTLTDAAEVSTPPAVELENSENPVILPEGTIVPAPDASLLSVETSQANAPVRTYNSAPVMLASPVPIRGAEEGDNEESSGGETGTDDPGTTTDDPGTTTTVFNHDEVNNSYVLVNYSGTDSLTADGDLTVMAAGLNHVGSISGTGKISFAGTGILLVDSLKGNPEFLTFTDIYSEGSTAVFVKQDNSDEYLLVNGSVPGILDEQYTITENVTLVMPNGTKLLLCGTGAAPKNDDSGALYYHGYDVDNNKVNDVNKSKAAESVGILTIAEQAALIVREGASIVMENLKSLLETGNHEGIRYSELIVNGGTLTVNGSVGDVGRVTLGEKSQVFGNGNITASKIKVDNPEVIKSSQVVLSSPEIFLNGEQVYENVIIHDSKVHLLSGAGINGLTSTGSSTVSEAANLSITKVEGILSLNSGGITPCVISGDIAGTGTICFERGGYIIPESTKLNDVKISKDGWGEIFDYSGTLNTSSTSYIPLRIGPTNITAANQSGGEIPVAGAALYYVDNVVQSSSIFKQETIEAKKNNEEWVLDWDDIQAKIDAYRETSGCSWPVAVQLLCFNGEVLSLEDPGKRISSNTTNTTGSGSTGSDTPQSSKLIPAGDVCLIRIIFGESVQSPAPTSDGTQTSTLYTGSGILGGDGAGSVNIGPGTTGSNTNTNTTNNPDTNNQNSTTAPKLASLMAYVNEAQEQTTLVWVELAPEVDPKTTSPMETVYILLALEGEKTLKEMGGKATVSMSYAPPAEYAGKPLYIVFRNRDNTLTAIRATYSNITKHLVFIADRLGEFMVVGFDFDGKEFSPEFYEALARLPELKNLIFSEYSPV